MLEMSKCELSLDSQSYLKRVCFNVFNIYFRRLPVLHMPSVRWGEHKAWSSEVIKL